MTRDQMIDEAVRRARVADAWDQWTCLEEIEEQIAADPVNAERMWPTVEGGRLSTVLRRYQ